MGLRFGAQSFSAASLHIRTSICFAFANLSTKWSCLHCNDSRAGELVNGNSTVRRGSLHANDFCKLWCVHLHSAGQQHHNIYKSVNARGSKLTSECLWHVWEGTRRACRQMGRSQACEHYNTKSVTNFEHECADVLRIHVSFVCNQQLASCRVTGMANTTEEWKGFIWRHACRCYTFFFLL